MIDIVVPDAISKIQALAVWEELTLARDGEHNYGSDTAEVYLYRVLPYNPTVRPFRDGDESHVENPCSEDKWCSTCELIEYYRTGSHALYDLCRQFEKENNVSIIIADGDLSLDDLITSVYTHRVHLTVRHNT